MKLMDINGIWINVVNLVSNYMYHKPPLGDGWDGVSWWNHPIFLVKSPKLGPEQRWRHKCSRGHWGGRGCSLQRPRDGGFFGFTKRLWCFETCQKVSCLKVSFPDGSIFGGYFGWFVDDVLIVDGAWFHAKPLSTLFSSACGMSSSVFQALSHLFKSLEKVLGKWDVPGVQDVSRHQLWKTSHLGAL